MFASTSPNAPASLKGGIDGDEYTVTPEMIAAFERDGYVHIPGVLTEAELAEVEEPMMRFIKGEVLPEGKDLCDMSGAVDRTPDEYTVFNAMLPRRYLPSIQGNVFERRAASIARQLTRGKDMSIDYDKLLAKRPGSPDSIFAWHQDLAYWPPLEKDPATATCWLAIDDSTVANGCMRFLPGSNKESTLRKHAPVRISKGRMDEESSHALATTLSPADEAAVRTVEIKRGDITVTISGWCTGRDRTTRRVGGGRTCWRLGRRRWWRRSVGWVFRTRTTTSSTGTRSTRGRKNQTRSEAQPR